MLLKQPRSAVIVVLIDAMQFELFINSVVGQSIELKPTILMWQCFHVLQFDLYQQKYQQSAKVPHNLDFTKQFSIVKNKQGE